MAREVLNNGDEAEIFRTKLNNNFTETYNRNQVVSLEEFGAVGDGVADDTAAIQAAVDTIAEGAIVRFAKRYRITDTIVLDNRGIVLEGFNVARPTSAVVSINTEGRVIADFTDGPAFLIATDGITVRGLTIVGSTARRAAPITTGPQNANSGIHIEREDASGVLLQNIVIEDVKITGQPADGITSEGDVTNLQINNCYVMDTGRHGISITGGELCGRTNKARPGIISITHGKVYDNGGHGLAVGHPSATGTSIPYRVYLRNWEHFRSATDAAQRHTDAGLYLFGSEITLMNCAPCGTTTGNVAARPVAFIAGRNIELINNRYIGFATNAVVIGQVPGYTTEGVTLRGGTASTSATVADFASIANGADGITIRDIDHPCTNPITATAYNPSTNLGMTFHDIVPNTTVYGAHTHNFTASTLLFKAGDALRAIAAGVITVAQPGSYRIDTEAAAASDDLVTINGAQYVGQEIILRQAVSGRVVTVVRGSGNIRLAGATNYTFPDTTTFLRLMWDGTNWREVGRAVSTG